MKPLEHVEPQKLEHGHANAWTRRWERVFAVPWMHGVGLGTYGTERYFAALVALAVWHLAVLCSTWARVALRSALVSLRRGSRGTCGTPGSDL